MRGAVGGMVQVELTGADTARSLKAINDRDIPMDRVDQTGDLTLTFWVRPGDLKALNGLCEKRGDKLRVLNRRGLRWTLGRLLRRPVLAAGLLFFLMLSCCLPGRVLFVRVEGNSRVPARRILAAAENCGVGFGASRRQVRSEKVKNALLGAIPELQWAGVNTAGCTAVISVRERTAQKEEAPRMQSIAAARDGFLLSLDVTRGTALVQPGQTVRAGQTLVSGYTDCGICIRATGAEGEIFAQTRREMEAVTPKIWVKRAGEREVHRKYSLLLRKKRINLWKDSGICDATCGRMYEEFYITLPGGFQLPAALCVETSISSELRSVALPEIGAEAALTQFASHYLQQQMVSGEIRGRAEQVTEGEDLYILEGIYDCTEMIGRGLKMGENNGKRD